jgi:malate synthase
MGEGRGVHRVIVGKAEGKRPMVRPRRRWEDNIKMDLQEVGGASGDWMELAQDRDRWPALVNKVMNLRVPKMRGIS